MKQSFIIIGISDEQTPELKQEILQQIKAGKNFAGGKRHHDLVKSFLPDSYHWENVTVPLENFYERLSKQSDWIVFASGDPLFFGIGISLKRAFPEASFQVYSQFNSLQYLAHKQMLPYGEARIITLTGRPWENLYEPLISEQKLIGSLTDKIRTPKSIAQCLLDAGYDNYRMHVGEHLGGEAEQIQCLSLEEAAQKDFAMPNCLYLEKLSERKIRKGIPETEFAILDGRPKMITKMPIRIATLTYMQLNHKTTFWDVGSCTGSVSVEARLHHPHLNMHAFEIRDEGEDLLRTNAKRFGAPGIHFYGGDFLQTDVSEIPNPDAVFLGGYGGKIQEVLDKININLQAEGIIAFNSVSEQSRTNFKNWAEENAFQFLVETRMQLDEFNPIYIIIIKKSKKFR